MSSEHTYDHVLTPTLRAKHKDLGEKMCQQFAWAEAHPFQLDGVLLQLARQDTIVHVGTGRGKTAIAAGPYVLEENAKKTTILISPLVALQEEMVRLLASISSIDDSYLQRMTFEKKFKLSAVVVNSTLGNELTQVLKVYTINRTQIEVMLTPNSIPGYNLWTLSHHPDFP